MKKVILKLYLRSLKPFKHPLNVLFSSRNANIQGEKSWRFQKQFQIFQKFSRSVQNRKSVPTASIQIEQNRLKSHFFESARLKNEHFHDFRVLMWTLARGIKPTGSFRSPGPCTCCYKSYSSTLCQGAAGLLSSRYIFETFFWSAIWGFLRFW